MIPTEFTRILNDDLISRLTSAEDQRAANRAKGIIENALLKLGDDSLSVDQRKHHTQRINGGISVLVQLEIKIRAVEATSKSAIGRALEAIAPTVGGLVKVAVKAGIESAANQLASRIK